MSTNHCFDACRRRVDRGSASLWVLACAALVLAVATIVVIRTQAVLARHRAESSADLAALAAAGRIGIGDDSCAEAERVAAANGSTVSTCTIFRAPDGLSGTVEIRVTVHADLLGARAASTSAWSRAGRDPPA